MNVIKFAYNALGKGRGLFAAMLLMVALYLITEYSGFLMIAAAFGLLYIVVG